MMLMRVSLVELLRQMAMGHFLAIEYMQSSACGLMQLRPIMLGG
jgi:hypothetical protein